MSPVRLGPGESFDNALECNSNVWESTRRPKFYPSREGPSTTQLWSHTTVCQVTPLTVLSMAAALLSRQRQP